MSDLFERATRQALRFQLPQGEIGVEQLWKVKEETLINYEEALTAEVESFGKTSRRKSVAKTALQEQAELRLAIVSYILDVKSSETESAQARAATKEHNQGILALIARKQAEQLANLSVAELEALLK